MIGRLFLLLSLFALLQTGAWSEGIKTTKVIGTEFPGEYKHPASFDQLDNGDLYLAYFGGGGEYEMDSKVWAMRLKKGEDEW
ncbi:MAG: hypothetical protein KC978_16705, partial [Candidatus Omnitrophica bacterium]|nr:hypothetical protein [Candidatus Omnitrophota bacterium]